MKKTFISGSGKKVTTDNKDEIKKMKACGWKEIKKAKEIFIKGKNGRNFV